MKNRWYQSGCTLLEEIKTSIYPKTMMAIWYIGQMGLVIRWNNTVIYIDPVLNDLFDKSGKSRRNYPIPYEAKAVDRVDYVICTHNHLDHMNIKTLLPMHTSNPEMKIIVPFPEMQSLVEGGMEAEAIIHAKEKEAIFLMDGIVLTPVGAAHESYVTDADGNQFNLGYVLDLGGIQLYHGGDGIVTDKLLEDISGYAPLDVVCLPINGRDAERHGRGIIGNMDCRDAAYLASEAKADIVLPLHYDMVVGNTENPLIFASYMEELYPTKKYHIMRLGEKIIFERKISKLN